MMSSTSVWRKMRKKPFSVMMRKTSLLLREMRRTYKKRTKKDAVGLKDVLLHYLQRKSLEE